MRSVISSVPIAATAASSSSQGTPRSVLVASWSNGAVAASEASRSTQPGAPRRCGAVAATTSGSGARVMVSAVAAASGDGGGAGTAAMT